MTFLNQVVLITGAGSGIGEATAIHFAKLSARLSLVDSNAAALAKTTEKCEKIIRTKILKQPVDLTIGDNAKKVVEKTYAEYGRIDAVINCAGILRNNNILSPNLIADFDDIMNINVRAIVAITNAAGPKLIETKGSIVNISSVGAYLNTDNLLAYYISKACVSTFTRCAALELAANGVRVNAIQPGPVATNILINAGIPEETNEKFWKNATKGVPLNHPLKTEEIAELAAFLAGDKAKSITGTNNVIDCGISLAGSQALPSLN